MALFLLDRRNGSIFIRLLEVRWPPLGGSSKPLAFEEVAIKRWLDRVRHITRLIPKLPAHFSSKYRVSIVNDTINDSRGDPKVSP